MSKVPERIHNTYGNCPACGKVCFRSRSAAKAAMKRRFPGEPGMSAYRCQKYPGDTVVWHYGHTPVAPDGFVFDRMLGRFTREATR